MRALMILIALASSLVLSGCLAVAATGAVVGTAVGVTGAAVGGAAKVGGAAVDAVIPDGDGDEDRREKRRRDD